MTKPEVAQLYQRSIEELTAQNPHAEPADAAFAASWQDRHAQVCPVKQKMLTPPTASTKQPKAAESRDPRILQANQGSNCALRYTMFCRCARELGEDNPRCKYQYYRAQIACTAEQIDEWNEHRSRGTCMFDIMPERSTKHLRQ